MFTSKFNFPLNLGRVVTSFFIMEEIAVGLLSVFNTPKAPESIEVPVTSSKFTISYDFKTMINLFLN